MPVGKQGFKNYGVVYINKVGNCAFSWIGMSLSFNFSNSMARCSFKMFQKGMDFLFHFNNNVFRLCDFGFLPWPAIDKMQGVSPA